MPLDVRMKDLGWDRRPHVLRFVDTLGTEQRRFVALYAPCTHVCMNRRVVITIMKFNNFFQMIFCYPNELHAYRAMNLLDGAHDSDKFRARKILRPALAERHAAVLSKCYLLLRAARHTAALTHGSL